MRLLPPPATLPCPALPCPPARGVLRASHGTRLPTEPSTTAPGPRPACLSTSGVSSHTHCPPTHRETLQLAEQGNRSVWEGASHGKGATQLPVVLPVRPSTGNQPLALRLRHLSKSLPLPSHISQKQAGKHGSCPPQPVGQPLPSAQPALQMCLVLCRGPPEILHSLCGEGWQKDWEWFKTNV